MQTNLKTIVVIDPLKGGHHDLYVEYTARGFIGLGYNVVTLSPIKEQLDKKLNCENVYYEEKFKYKNKFDVFLFTPIRIWKSLELELDKLSLDMENTIVFINWLDIYVSPLLPKLYFEKLFSYKFSGIYFRPNYLRRNKLIDRFLNFEKVFSSNNCISVGVIESYENIQRLYTSIKKPVYYFPDFIDESIDNVSETTIKDIENIYKLAKGRKKIGVIGSLQKRKNFIKLLQAVEKLDDKLYVVLYGKFNDKEFTQKELEIINNARKDKSRVYFKNQFIPTERDVNILYKNLDYVWNAYSNWKNTSNALTKASYFSKLAIVPQNSYLRDMVEKYSIGISCDEDSIESIKNALQKLLLSSFENENFTKFYKKNNFEALILSLNNLVLQSESFTQVGGQ